MPKLPNQLIAAKGPDDTRYSASVAASVSTEGKFRLQVPDELRDIVTAAHSRGNGVVDNVTQRTKWGFYERHRFQPGQPLFVEADTLQEASRVLLDAAKEHLQCEMKTETFIIYCLEIAAPIWIEPDGKIYPSGSCPSFEARAGHWHEMGSVPTLNSNRPAKGAYRVGVGAEAWDRTSFIRPSGTTYSWSRTKCANFGYETPLEKLQSFVCLELTPQTAGVKKMPYTDAAALWFHDCMLSLFRIAYGMDRFFSSEQNLLAIQEGRAPLLALNPPPNPTP